jgi:hypothetical protein
MPRSLSIVKIAQMSLLVMSTNRFVSFPTKPILTKTSKFNVIKHGTTLAIPS